MKVIKPKEENNEEAEFNSFHNCTCHKYVMDKIQKVIDTNDDINVDLDINNPTKTTIRLGIAQGIVLELTNLKEDL